MFIGLWPMPLFNLEAFTFPLSRQADCCLYPTDMLTTFRIKFRESAAQHRKTIREAYSRVTEKAGAVTRSPRCQGQH